MAADDLGQCSVLISHRTGLVVQQPGRKAPAGHGRGHALRSQVHRIFIHGGPQHGLTVLDSGESRRHLQNRCHLRPIDEGDGIAVTGHCPRVGHIPGQQLRQVVDMVVSCKNASCHGIFTLFPG